MRPRRCREHHRERRAATLGQQLPDNSRRSAPIAARTANSRTREVARASNRLPMLAQTISNTKPTAPNSIHSFGRMSETSSSCKGRTTSGESGLASSISGWAVAYWPFKTASSAVAWCRFTLGFNRPNTLRIGLSGAVIAPDHGPLRWPCHPRICTGERKLKAGRKHADYGVRRARQSDRVAEDRSITSEPPLPKCGADQRHRLRARAVFLREKTRGPAKD